MRNKIGNFFIILGTALMLGALSLFLWNKQEDRDARDASAEVLPQLVEQIKEARESAPETPEILPDVPEALLTEENLTMTEQFIDGYSYIGYLYIPELELELPVMADWDYDQLRISPCRYAGTIRSNDLVILAHSYASHFGHLPKLSIGSEVLFTDMDGNTWHYQVVFKEVLNPEDVKEMTAGEYDLTLFTCTTNGTHRFTVRCNKTNP